MRLLFLCSTFLFIVSGFAQNKDETDLRTVLAQQTAAWNRGDLPGFMEGYWKMTPWSLLGKMALPMAGTIRLLTTRRIIPIPWSWENFVSK